MLHALGHDRYKTEATVSNWIYNKVPELGARVQVVFTFVTHARPGVAEDWLILEGKVTSTNPTTRNFQIDTEKFPITSYWIKWRYVAEIEPETVDLEEAIV